MTTWSQGSPRLDIALLLKLYSMGGVKMLSFRIVPLKIWSSKLSLCLCFRFAGIIESLCKGTGTSDITGKNCAWVEGCSLVPRRFFAIRRKNTSGDPPIPF